MLVDLGAGGDSYPEPAGAAPGWALPLWTGYPFKSCAEQPGTGVFIFVHLPSKI